MDSLRTFDYNPNSYQNDVVLDSVPEDTVDVAAAPVIDANHERLQLDEQLNQQPDTQRAAQLEQMKNSLDAVAMKQMSTTPLNAINRELIHTKHTELGHLAEISDGSGLTHTGMLIITNQAELDAYEPPQGKPAFADGQWTVVYDDDAPVEPITQVAREGVWSTRDASDQVIAQETYVNDVRHGTASYFQDGHLTKRTEYVDGEQNFENTIVVPSYEGSIVGFQNNTVPEDFPLQSMAQHYERLITGEDDPRPDDMQFINHAKSHVPGLQSADFMEIAAAAAHEFNQAAMEQELAAYQ